MRVQAVRMTPTRLAVKQAKKVAWEIAVGLYHIFATIFIGLLFIAIAIFVLGLSPQDFQ